MSVPSTGYTIGGAATATTAPLTVQNTQADPAADFIPIYSSVAAGTVAVNIQNLLGVATQVMATGDTQSVSNKTLDNTNVYAPKDTSFTLQNASSSTKRAQFLLSSITAGQTRIFTLPDYNGVLATRAGTETLTNKTLTTPTITAPTITNANITADTINGFTTSGSGTIFGIAVASSVITTANVVGTAALASGAVTSAKIASGAVTSPALALSLETRGIHYDGGGSTSYSLTNSYAAITGLTAPSITVDAGVVLVVGSVNIQQGSATSADVKVKVVMGATGPNYPTAGEVQVTYSSATANNRSSASVCFLFTGVSVGTYTFTAQALTTAGTFSIDNTHTNLQVIPLNS
jgi:hypothetical protein